MAVSVRLLSGAEPSRGGGERKAEPWAAAQEIIRALVGASRPDEILARVVDLVRYCVKVPVAAVPHVDGGARFPRPIRWVDRLPGGRGASRVQPGEGSGGIASRPRRPAWLNDNHGPNGHRLEANASRRGLASEGIRAILAASLRARGEPVSVIPAYPRTVRVGAGAEAALVGLIADVASLALDRGEAVERAMEQAVLTGLRQIVGTLCHEINTPPASLLGTLQLLQRRGVASPDDAGSPDRPHQDDALAAMLSAGQEIADILRRAQLMDRYRTTEHVGRRRMIDLVA